MGFLLAKIFILLMLAAIAGALLMYWWVRRRYEDVSLEFSRIATQRDALQAELDRHQETDLDGLKKAILGRMDGLDEQVQALEKSIAAAPCHR